MQLANKRSGSGNNQWNQHARTKNLQLDGMLFYETAKTASTRPPAADRKRSLLVDKCKAKDKFIPQN